MSTPAPKRLLEVIRQPRRHWVGDGFPVRTLFTYSRHGELLSPFLLLDYAEPSEFPPTTERKGVGEHPHRGFETVTVVYAGEVEHRDSGGGGGIIGPGDVQWMTAGSGLVHEEFHGPHYARKGGPFEMHQLWVNLPAASKGERPHYQPITAEQIPVLPIPGGQLRVLAGDHQGTRGPARTFSPLQVWDLTWDEGLPLDLRLPEGWSLGLALRRGTLKIDNHKAGPGEVAVFSLEGSTVHLEPEPGTALLLLSGQPLNEPIAGSGPFVMNTQQELVQAYDDFEAGRMGRLT
nr:pirin family protein [uncultured Holophaga sp.]